jgi:hypothetical protein
MTQMTAFEEKADQSIVYSDSSSSSESDEERSEKQPKKKLLSVYHKSGMAIQHSKE